MLYEGNHFLDSQLPTKNRKCKTENSTCLIIPETVSGTLLVMASVDMFKIGLC